MYVAYKYDNDGYFIGTELIQDFNNIPNDCTLVEPILRNDAWSKWNENSWGYEHKPQDISYYIENNISYDTKNKSPINIEKIALLVNFVNENSEYMYEIQDDRIFVKKVKELDESDSEVENPSGSETTQETTQAEQE